MEVSYYNMEYEFLFDVAMIMLFTKLFGVFSKRLHMPQIVGAIIAGIILGPIALNIIHEPDFISKLSDLGVIILMFSAGMEINIKDIKKSNASTFLIAFLGVIIPLISGFFIATLFNGGFNNLGTKQLIENIFIGVILTATSVNITVETLREFGLFDTKVGMIIKRAALIDDVLAIIILTIVSSVSQTGTSLWLVIFKFILFIALSIVVGYPFNYLFEKITNNQKERRRFVLISFGLCLLLAFVSYKFFGVLDICGAFIAGLIFSNTKQVSFINRRFEILSYIIITPIFFANIGLSIPPSFLSLNIIIFSICLAVVGILSKFFGCGLGALIKKYSTQDSLSIGVGMIARGELALIFAMKAVSLGLIRGDYLGSIVLLVIISGILSPILIKLVFKQKQAC